MLKGLTLRKRKQRTGLVETAYDGLQAPLAPLAKFGLGLLFFVSLAVSGELVYAMIHALFAPQESRQWPSYGEVACAFALLTLSAVCLWLAGKRIPIATNKPSLTTVEPRSALLVPLSTFSVRQSEPRGAYGTLAELENHVEHLRERIATAGAHRERLGFNFEEARSAFWDRVAPTSFGPLFLAIQAHFPKLKRVVLISTSQTSKELQAVNTSLSLLWSSVDVKAVTLSDAMDVAKIVEELCPEVDDLIKTYMANEVIADFTSGTAATSAAINLVCLDEEIGLQYTRQDQPLFLVESGVIRARPVAELVGTRALAEIRTSRQHVPADVRV